MDRLWVVQARFYGSKENWGVCSFISPLPFAATNYFEAHQLKRDIQEELFARCSWWTPDKFRVREYVERKWL